MIFGQYLGVWNSFTWPSGRSTQNGWRSQWTRGWSQNTLRRTERTWRWESRFIRSKRLGTVMFAGYKCQSSPSPWPRLWQQSQQHWSGHPSKYCTGPSLLNFCDLTGTGVANELGHQYKFSCAPGSRGIFSNYWRRRKNLSQTKQARMFGKV